MKRIGIAGAVLVLGILLLPAIRDFLEEITAAIMAGMTGQKYMGFIQLFTDNIYLAAIVLWIGAIAIIIFWPKGEETSEIQRR